MDSDSSIDSSVWLPRDASVVKPERVAKGDMEITIKHGRISAANVRDDSYLGYLIQTGILEDHHSYYAMAFLDMRRYFRRVVDFKGNGIYAKQFLSVSNSGILEAIYLRVCRLLGRQYEDEVLYCIGERSRPPVLPDYRGAFDALVSAVDTTRKELESE